MKHFFLLAVLALAACKEEVAQVPDPIPLTDTALSHFCQMNVSEHGGPKAQIHLEDYLAPIFFAQVRDAVAYLKSPERDARVLAVYVSDMGAAVSWSKPGIHNWINAEETLFVVGAPVAGGMGAPEIVPFASREKAEAFRLKYGGLIFAFKDIPDNAALGAVDTEIRLEEPIW